MKNSTSILFVLALAAGAHGATTEWVGTANGADAGAIIMSGGQLQNVSHWSNGVPDGTTDVIVRQHWTRAMGAGTLQMKSLEVKGDFQFLTLTGDEENAVRNGTYNQADYKAPTLIVGDGGMSFSGEGNLNLGNVEYRYGFDQIIIGGDITGADKIFVSVAAIGRTSGRRISSRKNAKVGQKIIVAGLHGSSSAGLRLLMNGQKEPEKFIKAHLTPLAQVEFSRGIAENIKEDYAMMDTSDGLADALSQIAEASGVNIEIDFSEILYDKDLERFEDYKDLILFGGEDYGLVASVNDDIAKDFTVIGEVKKGSGVTVLYQNGLRKKFSKTDVENRIFNHF